LNTAPLLSDCKLPREPRRDAEAIGKPSAHKFTGVNNSSCLAALLRNFFRAATFNVPRLFRRKAYPNRLSARVITCNPLRVLSFLLWRS
jgi:hypothetical protein